MESDQTESLGIIGHIAKALGAPEDGITLMISLLLGYPLAVIYRKFLYGKAANLQHLYFAACGLSLCYFNFGTSTIHSVINIAVIYVMLQFLKGTTASVVFSYVFNTTYLVIGYTYTMTGSYGVRWTTSQCVLCLRLTGLVLDLYDGRKKPEKRSNEQKETALQEMPSLLEICGHCFFFGGFLVGPQVSTIFGGPQFNMKRYLDFIKGAFSDKVSGGLPNSVTPALKRLAAGVAYTAVFQIVHIFLPDRYLISENFMTHNVLVRCGIIMLWGKFQLYKYLGVWLLTEGTCILTGITYNGLDKNGNILWNGCANIFIRKFENSNSCGDLILAFNVNTNRWMAKYLFKRLKWAGSKYISQGVTLCYLALWHGIYSGYFHNFFMEFIIINLEKGVADLHSKSPAFQKFTSQSVNKVVLFVVRKIYTWFAISYALVSFCLFTHQKYMQVYASVYFAGHIPFLLWPVLAPTFYKWLKPKSTTKAVQLNGSTDKTEHEKVQ